eukprot:245005-Prymnesium_polylepis.2
MSPSTPPPTPAPCFDTPDFVNPQGQGCDAYASIGACVNGAVPTGFEWAVGAMFLFPELNCC